MTAELALEPIDHPDAVAAEWDALARRAGDPFATREWAVTWCRHLLAGRPLRLLACRRPDGGLAAILPLYEAARRPLRVLRFLGSGPADRQGPICDPADRPAAAGALRRALAVAGGDVLLAERLPGDGEWSGLLGAGPIQREASPVLRIAGRGWDELLAARSANFRQQVRRRERQLQRGRELRYRLADDPERLGDDLTALAALHAARWHDGGSDALSGAKMTFHDEFARLSLHRGWLRLWLLELDGRPAAAWYGFRFGGADWFYQSGRDPAHDRLAVGFVLMAHTVREAAQDGMRDYHLLRGDDPYKARFASEDHGLETVALARGARGRAAVAVARSAAALPPARRALRRFAG